MRVLSVALVGVGAAVIAAFSIRGVHAREPAWVIVARDANYNVSLDPANVSVEYVPIWGRARQAFGVTFRTDHAKPRMYKEQAFDREVVRSLVQCDSLWFQVLSVDMFRGDKLIARQRDEPEDAQWRRVERGSTEEIAAQAACHYGRFARDPNARAALRIIEREPERPVK